MQRIGVFVCHCGTNIAGTVDVKAVAEAIKKEPGVVFSTDYQYMCSQAGQDLIKNAVAENKLSGIVVCSCSPRMHEATFRKTAAAAGLNPYMVEIANIREQCSWVHKDMLTGTQKAVILAKAAEYARKAIAGGNTPLTEDQWMNSKTGFNTPQSSWMLGTYVTSKEEVNTGYYYCTFIAQMTSEPTWGMARYRKL